MVENAHLYPHLALLTNIVVRGSAIATIKVPGDDQVVRPEVLQEATRREMAYLTSVDQAADQVLMTKKVRTG